METGSSSGKVKSMVRMGLSGGVGCKDGCLDAGNGGRVDDG